jgi:hypothetical protein
MRSIRQTNINNIQIPNIKINRRNIIFGLMIQINLIQGYAINWLTFQQDNDVNFLNLDAK